METYEELKNVIIERFGKIFTKSMLQKLKNLYESYIQSNRRLSYVSNLQEMIKLLEKFDLLSADNVLAFVNICELVGEPIYRTHVCNIVHYILVEVPKQRILSRTHPMANSAEFDVFTPFSGSDFSSFSNSQQSEISNSVLSPVDTNPKSLCFQLLSQKLGDNWKRVARKLGMGEGDIDAIYYSDLRINMKILKMLRELEEPLGSLHNPRLVRTNLERALRDVGRYDLANKVAMIYDEFS